MAKGTWSDAQMIALMTQKMYKFGNLVRIRSDAPVRFWSLHSAHRSA